MDITALKVSKYRVFCGPYIPVLGLNSEKYGPEKTPYLETFHAVYSMFTVWTFHCKENKHDEYRGEDCMKKYFEFLREPTMNTDNFEKKKMIPLTTGFVLQEKNLLHLQKESLT